MMRVASLTNRIFLACTLLATLSLGFAFYFVNARATIEAEAALERELTDAASLVDQQRQQLTDSYTQMARVVADSLDAQGGGRDWRPADGAAARPTTI